MIGWVATAVTVAAYDVWAIRSGRRPTMCAVARRHPCTTLAGIVLFLIHLWPPRLGADTRS